jgi:hypothetical protein
VVAHWKTPSPAENHAISLHQPSVLSAPHYQPEKGSVKVEPTKEDDLDRPGHNLRAGRADIDGAMRECPHFGGGVRPIASAKESGLRGVSRRDEAKPSREPEQGRQVAASAGGRRAKRRCAPESPRPCRLVPPLHEAAPIQRSAARFRVGRQFPPSGCPAGFGQRVLPGECHSTACNSSVTYARPALPFWGKETSVPLKENETTFS